MNGAVELFKAAQKHGIKPLLGLEAYFVDDRKERDRKIERNHLTLLAATNEGFKNLTTLSSKGFLEGLYRGKPGVDLELLSEHAEGVICLTGCLASRTSQRIIEAKEQRRPRPPGRAGPGLRARGRLSRGPEERADRAGAGQRGDAAFAAETGRPMVATADVHYLRKEDFHHHAALLCVQTKSTLAAPKMSFTTNEFYLKSLRGDGGVVRRLPGRAGVDARDRRALRGRHRARRPADPALRLPGGAEPRRSTSARSSRRACAAATAIRRPPRPSSGWRWSSASSIRWASTPTS